MFLISTTDPWYGDIIIYLETLRYQPAATRDEHRRIHHQAKYYLILNDTLYRHGDDSILRRCLTHEEVEIILNDCHSGACGIHLSGLATTQKILRAVYFWPLILKDCIETVKKCSPCQICTTKKCTHPTSLHHVGEVGTFVKWGIEFVHCRPTSARGHGYIIMAVEYFTKWAEAMPTYAKDEKITALFLFNHIIARFGIPRAIVMGHTSKTK